MPGCREAGEFRAPNPYTGVANDAPPDWQWLCLDHVREFNTRYNYFDGMSREEIELAQMPLSGWARETRAFAHGGGDSPPRWADFNDPLEAISARFRTSAAESLGGVRLSQTDRQALATLGLGADADRKAVRTAYSTLVRRYHPDRNGGDRSHEKKLHGVIDAYQQLRASKAFA